jgi:hypothetical protein
VSIDLSRAFPEPGGECRPLARLFGVRHLSPAAAHHLHEVLDALRPTAVLVEGPADATDQVPHLAHKETRPPLALLAYTQDRPVRSILYPLAEYSPEWVALLWGIRHKADVRFIDLPAAVFLQLHQVTRPNQAEEKDGPVDESDLRGQKPSQHTLAYLDDPYAAIARLAGDPDHETWWERHFEHTAQPESYLHQIYAFGRGLRGLRELKENDENLIREAHMRRCIHEVMAKGHRPDRVLVVCGAFHTAALTQDLPPMSDQEYNALPRVQTSLTLMPYSYYRLSSQSGYGAGNHAPAYFQSLYEERRAGRTDQLAPQFFTEAVHAMRKSGQLRSAADVIEAVRLAQGLAALAGSSAPCLRDLRDAAITLLGRGEVEVVRPFLAEIEIGSAVGRLPKGISRTSIQDDFYYHIEALGLGKYQSEKSQELVLDLRENRFVKSREAAFKDLNRSTFLHRLQILGVRFGDKLPSGQDQATWKEVWKLRWTPECEIQLVESALKGDTVEMAAALRLSERLAECERIEQAADVVHDAATCSLSDALEDAQKRLQAMALDVSAVVPLAWTIDSLAEVIRYGSVRKFDPEPLRPLLAQLFLRATLQLQQECLCDEAAAKGIGDREENARRSKHGDRKDRIFKGPEEVGVRRALLILDRVAGEMAEHVDAARWHAELDAVAAADNLNPFLSGLAGALVLEKGRISEDELAREVSRRLSPGVPAELGAGWFEGLVSYNRMALFSRLALWRQLDLYIGSLDEDAFRNALVYLRRAFGDFDQSEIRRVVSNLVEVSSDAAGQLKETVDTKLSDEEARKLQELLGGLEL